MHSLLLHCQQHVLVIACTLDRFFPTLDPSRKNHAARPEETPRTNCTRTAYKKHESVSRYVISARKSLNIGPRIGSSRHRIAREDYSIIHQEPVPRCFPTFTPKSDIFVSYAGFMINLTTVRPHQRWERTLTHVPVSTCEPKVKGDMRRIVRLPCEGPFPCPPLVLALWGFPLSPLPMDFLNIDFLRGGGEEQMVY
jgi:hypothetical protein